MSNLNRRTFLAVAGATGAAATLAACAGSGSGSGGGGQEGEAGKIVFWSNHPGSSKDTEQEIIDAFQKENPDITVELVDAGKNYEEVAQKFNAALSGGDLPDVIVASDVNWFNFALNKQFAPLDDLFDEAGFEKDDYVDALLGDYEFEGQHWGVPFARSTTVFYYNKDVWKKAGLEDRGPKDWDELIEWAPKITDALGGDGKAIGMYDGANYLDWTIQNLLWENDGGFSTEWDLTFTSEGTKKGLQTLIDLNKDGHVTFSEDSVVELSAELVGCAFASTGSIAAVKEQAKFDWGTAFLPGAEANNTCPTGGAGVAIPAGISDERKKNAMKFIAFLTNPDNAAKFAKATGYMPVRKSATESTDIKDYLKETPQAETAINQLPHTRPQDYARVFVPNPGTRIGGALDRILASGDIDGEMQKCQDETQDLIDKDIKPLLGQ